MENGEQPQVLARFGKPLLDSIWHDFMVNGMTRNQIMEKYSSDTLRANGLIGRIIKLGLINKNKYINQIDFVPVDFYAVGYIYVINAENTNYYKIGICGNSQRLASRLVGIQVGNPLKLRIVKFYEVVDYMYLEKHIHNMFREKETPAQNEWFSLNNADLAKMDLFLNNNLFENNIVKHI